MTGSWEVVARILQRQELLHESQVEQWKATVSEANQKLLQVRTGSLEARASQEYTFAQHNRDRHTLHHQCSMHHYFLVRSLRNIPSKVHLCKTTNAQILFFFSLAQEKSVTDNRHA